MNPCKNNREATALFATGSLDEGAAEALRSHLEHCDQCREYLKQLVVIADDLNALAAPEAHVDSDAFHNQFLRRIRQENSHAESTEQPVSVFALRPIWSWIGAGFAVFLILLSVRFHERPRWTAAAAPRAIIAAQNKFSATQKSTRLNDYRMAAERSPEILDEMLNSQANAGVAPPGTVTLAALLASD